MFIQCKKQKGTSITEALVLMLILIPLFLIVPMLAKVANFKMKIPQTSRYAGWQEVMTGSASNNQVLALEIQERILKTNNVAIQSQQQDTADNNQQNLWSHQSRRIHDTTHGQATTVNRVLPTSSTDITTGIMKATTTSLSAISKGSFVANYGEVIQHEVGFLTQAPGLVKNSNCGSTQAQSNLCFQQKHAIFAHSLAPSSADEMRDNVNSLKPFSSVTPIVNALSTLTRASWFFKEGALLKDMPLHVNTEALPDDRLEQN